MGIWQIKLWSPWMTSRLQYIVVVCDWTWVAEDMAFDEPRAGGIRGCFVIFRKDALDPTPVKFFCLRV